MHFAAASVKETANGISENFVATDIKPCHLGPQPNKLMLFESVAMASCMEVRS
jgi:hypothetical protein